MRTVMLTLLALGVSSFALAAPASGASKNVERADDAARGEGRHGDQLPGVQADRSGARRDARHRALRAEVLLARRPARATAAGRDHGRGAAAAGRPAGRLHPDSAPRSTFWQNEDMDVDKRRKFVLLSRDPRAYAGSTTREPGEADPNGATKIAGVYVVDAKEPERLQLLSFKQLPTGHTTTCINDCQWLWTGGPAATRAPAGDRLDVRAADHRHRPQQPAPTRSAYPTDARWTCSGATADRLLARRSGRRHGHRVGVRRWRHARLLDRGPALRPARRARGARRRSTRSRTRGGGLPHPSPATTNGGFEHNAGGPSAPTRRRATRATRAASCCW